MVPEVDKAVAGIAGQLGLVDYAIQTGYPFGEQPLRPGPGDQPHLRPCRDESLDGWKGDHQIPKPVGYGGDKGAAHRQRGT